MSRLDHHRPWPAWRIAVAYVACGFSWILLSDWAIAALARAPKPVTVVEMAKGLFFVAGTGAVLFLLLRGRELALREESSKLGALVQGSPYPVALLDLDGRILLWSTSAAGLFGWSEAQVIGAALPIFGDDPSGVLDHLLASVRAGRSFRRPVASCRRQDGATVRIDVAASPVHDGRGAVVGVALVCADLTARFEAEEKVRFLSNYDTVTGLPNRRLLVDLAEQTATTARRRGTRLALVMVDVGPLKRISDSLGPATGDRFLAQLGDRLRQAAGELDEVGHLGGDRFAVLLGGLETERQVALEAQRLREVLTRPLVVDGRTFHPSVTMGAQLYPPGGGTFDEALRQAGAALSRAKAGGTLIEYYEAGLAATLAQRLSLESELRTILATDGLGLAFQPIVDLRRSRSVGVEVLARWHHRERGLILPEFFVPLAEDGGFSAEIDRAVLHAALGTAGQRAGLDGSWMSVNLSVASLSNPSLDAELKRELATSGWPAERLVLEVTESAAMHDPATSQETLRRLRRLGVRVALDDFGTGFSSLAQLKDLPVDLIKIDRSFIAGIGRTPSDERVIESVLALSRHFGLETVAEGIETEAQLTWLRRNRCPFGQGFHLAPPSETVVGAVSPA